MRISWNIFYVDFIIFSVVIVVGVSGLAVSALNCWECWLLMTSLFIDCDGKDSTAVA